MKDLVILERRREIAQIVALHGRVTVDEIRHRFGVSSVTARNDLDALAETGDLVRSHGGAVKPESAAVPTVHQAPSTATEEQTRLAAAAVQLIHPLETVMLCPGDATNQMANLIRHRFPHSLTVITYSLQIASALSEAPQVSLVMLGGLHRYPSGSFVGPHAEHMMKSLHAGHCFLNSPGLSAQSGLTTTDIMEAHLNQCMLEAASQVTVLAEKRSFGYRSLALVAEIQNIDRIICDASVPAGDLAALRQQSLELVLV